MTTMIMTMKHFGIFLWLHLCVVSSGFIITTKFNNPTSQNERRRNSRLHQQQQGSDDVASPSNSDLLASLYARQKDLEKGIGKRYVVRTMIGFLNVHSSYMDGPYETSNIVRSLSEGTIITSTGPNVTIGFPPEQWIPHDKGGWSVAKFRGFTWLDEIEE
jgi:hypothetical protein